MKRALVAIKRVVDYKVRIRVNADGSGVAVDGMKLSINPFDEIALEEALRMREQRVVDEVVAVTVGSEDCQPHLRTALALGADRALHVLTDETLEPLHVARLLHEVVRRETPLLVVLGKQAIDDDNGQTGQMLAALWQRPQATYASRLEFGNGTVRVTREVDSGFEVIEADLPAVITAGLRLNEPRLAKLPSILKAKSKPLETLTPAELAVAFTPLQRVVKVEPQPHRERGIMVQSAAELVAALRKMGLL